MDKPRVALLVPDVISHPSGGLGVHAQALVRHLSNQYEFTVLGHPDKDAGDGYVGITSSFPRIMHPSMHTILSQGDYIEAIIKSKPDIIHVTDYTLLLAGVTASRALGVPLVATVQLSSFTLREVGMIHAYAPESADGKAIQNAFHAMELLGLEHAAHIIHVSQYYKERFKAIGNFDHKSSYVPNGIEPDEWSNPSRIQLPGTRPNKVVFLGRMAVQKNITELINAVIPENVDLIIYGLEDGSDPALVEAVRLRAHMAENLHLQAPVYGKEKTAVLHSADALILPSIHECHPITMHEALVSDSILIASDTGDVPFVVPEDIRIKCGLSRTSIADALNDFSNMTPSERDVRIKKGREMVRNYTWERTANETSHIYMNVLKL